MTMATLGILLSVTLSGAAAEGNAEKVEVIAAKAGEPGKKLENLPADLKPYASYLKAAAPGFGKFESGGSGDCAAAAGNSAKASAGGISLEAQVLKVEDGKLTVKNVVKGADGKEVGSQTVTLKKGSVHPTAAGSAESPVVFIVHVK